MLPEVLNNIKEAINNDVFIKIEISEKIVEEVLDKKCDIALIESPIFKEGLIYREWMEDELVLFSNTPLPKYVKKDDLHKFNWICRDEGSHTRKLVSEVFETMGVECKSFNVISEVSSSTAVVQTILRSSVNKEHPTVSIISRYAIANEVESGKLFEAKNKRT